MVRHSLSVLPKSRPVDLLNCHVSVPFATATSTKTPKPAVGERRTVAGTRMPPILRALAWKRP
eukprot:scaffold85452_cov72-Phaeocystis_antarctica.AAC.4